MYFVHILCDEITLSQWNPLTVLLLTCWFITPLWLWSGLTCGCFYHNCYCIYPNYIANQHYSRNIKWLHLNGDASQSLASSYASVHNFWHMFLKQTAVLSQLWTLVYSVHVSLLRSVIPYAILYVTSFYMAIFKCPKLDFSKL